MTDILSIDPGITTGICVYNSGLDLPERYDTFCIPKAFEPVYMLVKEGHWDLVICEGFATPGAIASYGIDTVELIGAVKGLCYIVKQELVIQYPIERRNSLTDADNVLRRVLGVSRYQPHQRDSLAHVLAYQRKHKEQFPDYVELIQRLDSGAI